MPWSYHSRIKRLKCYLAQTADDKTEKLAKRNNLLCFRTDGTI